MLLTGIIISLVLSAWFAGSETVFLSFNKVYLSAWVRQKIKGSGAVRFMISQPERFLATTLTGNNLVNVLYSSLIAIFLSKFGIPEEWIAFFIAPFILLIFGEAIPKSIARQIADRVILLVASGLRFCRIILYPAIKALELSVRYFQRRFNINIFSMEGILNRADIATVLQESEQAGRFGIGARPLIRGLINLTDKRVIDIMTHRTSVVAMDVDTPLDEARRIMHESGCSRIPCYKEELDNIIGFVTAQSLIAAKDNLSAALKKIPLVPGSISVISLLKWLRVNKTGFACVIDEFGGFAGVVTVEDLVEEIFGPIQDEYDLANPGIWQISANKWIVNAGMKLSQVSMLTGFTTKVARARSLGGLITKLAEDIPPAGREFDLPEARLKVLKSDRKGAGLIQLTLKNVESKPVKS